jgi:lysophospholipid acyltransferase
MANHSFSHSHLVRMVTDYAGVQVDYSAVLMMMTLRIVSVAFNYTDWPRREQQDPVVAEKAIEHFPDILSYLAFTFYFPALLAGPVYDYKYFNEFVSDYHLHEKKEPIEVRPNLFAVIYNFFMIGVAFAGFSQIDKYSRDIIMYRKDEFSQYSFVYKMIFIQCMMTCFKFRYYLVWYIAQGACLLTGFGYVPKTKKWNGLRQCNLWAFELSTSPYLLASEWNVSVHLWLKNYGYLRNKRRGQKPTSFQVFYTFGVSAAWHGFYPGYYIFFFLAGLGVYIGRLFRAILRHRVVGDKDVSGFKVFKYPTVMIYNVLGYILTMGGTNYISASFALLSIQETIYLWKETYALPIVVGLFINFVLKVLYPKYALRKSETAAAITDKKQQ